MVNKGLKMKTSTLRAAICIALFTAGSAASPAKALGAQVEQETEPQVHSEDALPPVEAGDAEVTELASMTVTGTRIRGGATPSPVIDITRERIREEGFTDLGEVIRSVPQNFRGGQNPGVAVGATLGAGGRANQNITGGSSLNLRGLGPDATLTLLNGRRMAAGGFVPAVDISAIPVDAIERIEILPDGASAIYGSDAVGGVGNVLLKQDYQGVAASVRHGGATSGGMFARDYAITLGTTWPSGGVISTWRDVSTDAINARQRSYTDHMFEPTTLYPESKLTSGLISMHQSVTDTFELRLDAMMAEREQEMYQWNTGLTPWYNQLLPETTAYLIAPSLNILLPGDWALSFGSDWSEGKHVQRQAWIDIATGVVTPLVDSCYCNKISSIDASAEGRIFALPAGDARVALGVGKRSNEYRQPDYIANSVVVQGKEGNQFAYAEVSLPLMSPDLRTDGLSRLELSAAARRESYDSFGSVTTPKVGLIYSPGKNATFKASWGKSFKAPTLLERHYTREAVLRTADYYGGSDHDPNATVLSLGGGNPDLGPERATTLSASIAIHPESLPGLEASIGWFDIDYKNRVVQPITDFRRALVNPNYDQFIDRSPTAQVKEEVLSISDIFYNLTGSEYDPSQVVAVMYQQYLNVAQQRIRGADLSVSYRMQPRHGSLTIRGSASWLESSQKNGESSDSFDVAGTIFNPAKLNGRVGMVWSWRGFTTSAFANYTGGVYDGVQEKKTSSFTTFDTVVSYQNGSESGLLSGLELAFSVQNMFNREPPLYAAATVDRPPYDSTNYSPIGRYVSVSLTKRW